MVNTIIMFYHLFLAVLFRQLIFAVQCNAEADAVCEQSYIEVVGNLSTLHEQWPPKSVVPPSNITGLTGDSCKEHADCKPPRACRVRTGRLACSNPPPLEIVCQTSNDCDTGESCAWEPWYGLTSGYCFSNNRFQGDPVVILNEPLQIPLPNRKGLTGDRCFMQSNCFGTRSCLGVVSGALVTSDGPKQLSICAPLTFIPCLSSVNCTEPGEICASLNTSSLKATNSTFSTVLPPLCLSEALVANENVIPVSNFSYNLCASGFFMDYISEEDDGEETYAYFNTTDTLTTMAAFSVPSLPVFNSFTTIELANDYIAGILSVIILSQLRNIFSGIIYGSAGIHYIGYSSYIIFSRLLSFRHVYRLIKRREPYKPSASQSPSGIKLGMNFRLALLPLLTLAVLYVAEIGTIISGSQIRQDYFAEQNFDPVISLVSGTPRPRERFNENCDDFFVPTRGLQQRGRVLKCVQITTPKWDASKIKARIEFNMFFKPSWTAVKIHDQNGEYSVVSLSTFLLSASGNRFETRPIRFDLMTKKSQEKFLNGFLNAVRRRLAYRPLNTNLHLWSIYAYPVEYYSFHTHGWNDSIERITDAVVDELREMDLVLNSTGTPWVLIPPDGIEQQNPWMAVLKPYRVAHGWMLILAVLVTILNVITNTSATHFDEVAYTAMREMIGDVCILGPLAKYEDHIDSVNVEDNDVK